MCSPRLLHGQRMETTEKDWDAADAQLLTAMWSQLVLIRSFEEYLLEMAAEGLVHGPVHSSIGQEGGAVGSVLALKEGDTANGSHRGHHQFLAKALAYVEPKGIDPTAEFSDEVRTLLLRTLAEICGLDRGFGHGRGGSMHLQWTEAGSIGTNALVGAASRWPPARPGRTSMPVPTQLRSPISATAPSTSAPRWSRSTWRPPGGSPCASSSRITIYAVSTSVEEATGEPRLSARGPGFGIPELPGRRDERPGDVPDHERGPGADARR